MTTKQNWDELLELANFYPSPHNGQPIRLKIQSDNRLELHFVKERGLQAADVSFIFSFVSMGVFVEHLRQCAQALGHELKFEARLPKEQDLRGSGLVVFGLCNVNWDTQAKNEAIEQALRFRQTSRKKYYQGIDKTVTGEISVIAEEAGMETGRLDNQGAKEAIWLNQRAVFDDMFDDATRHELDHWLRYSPEQKLAKRDGLAYDCMELNGRMVKFIVNHHKILRWPVISSLLKQYYLRTMADKSDVFYMLAPFTTEKDAFDVGVVIMKIWLSISKGGCYLHPFGTIMSNHAAHRDFVKLAGIEDKSKDKRYLVFIFRAGKSNTPIRSLRLPYDRHLLLT